jgi:hypothetical protein
MPVLLPAFDAQHLSDFLACALRTNTVTGFEVLVREHIKPVLRHEMMAACIGTFSGDHLTIDQLIGVDYPAGALSAVPRVCVHYQSAKPCGNGCTPASR